MTEPNNVTGWSGVVEKIHENNDVGFTSLRSDGYDFEVFFNAEDLYIDGEQCKNTTYWNGLNKCTPVGTQIHFDAEMFSKPVYEHGYNVWYQASLVWIGNKPSFDEDSSEGSYDDESDDDEDTPDVTCHSGRVIAFVNHQRTAILESTVNNKVKLVALERCRFYKYDEGDFQQPQHKLTESLDIDDWVQFEAFYLDSPHPCGVTLRAGLGWVGYRPDYDLNRPTHLLKLPNNF